MSTSRRVICGLLLVGMVLVAASSAKADSRRARRVRQQARAYVIQMRFRAADVASAQAQYSAGQQALNSAAGRESNAVAQLTAAIGRVRFAADELRRARTIEVELQKDLADVEDDLLGEQPAKSAYARTLAEVQSLREESKRREMQLLQTSDYVARKAALAVEPESPTAVARLRQETLDRDEAYVALQRQLANATEQLALIKRELFAADDEWKDTHEALVAARKVTRGAGNAVELASPGRIEIAHDLYEARRAEAAARSVISQADAVLQQLSAPTTPKKSGGAGSGKK